MPAEWERCDAILMAAPDEHTDWSHTLKEAINQYQRIIRTFSEAGETILLVCRDARKASELYQISPGGKILFAECDYNDTWVRDYGPITTFCNDRFETIDFGFNAWGLKFAADKDNLVTSKLHASGFLNKEYFDNRSFILEGGSIESDGKGIGLTTSECLLSPNRNPSYSQKEIADVLKCELGFKRLLWLNHGALAGDDTDSHIDTIARLCPNNTIAYVACSDTTDSHYEELKSMEQEILEFRNCEGDKFNCIALPLPDPTYDDDGNRLPATYANFLVTPRNLFIPVYNQPKKDAEAVKILSELFPDKRVFTIDCRILILQHGSLHCATMQLPLESHL